MKQSFQYGQDEITLDLPDDSILYQSNYQYSGLPVPEMLLNSLAHPVGSAALRELIPGKKPGKVVIVVSDITRPIPYSLFLPDLVGYLENSGIKKEEITILIATGMHRASTKTEQIRMFGRFVVDNYRIIDHDCQDDHSLKELPGRSWSGSRIRLNSHYVDAGFRIVTGLVEPHFMAGFSGGRKAICPGLVSLETVQKFHGYKFLSHHNAASGILTGNPCHEENSSIAKMCPPDFCINIVLDNDKNINTIVSGELFASHRETVDYVKGACCPPVTFPADVALTSCGGYPLDATFYQCVKGFVNCLPAIKEGGEIISFGACSEGIGSPEYRGIMKKYSRDPNQFIDQIKDEHFFIKDQWEYQMHIRALEKTGRQNLHFYTSGIPQEELSCLAVNPHAVDAGSIQASLQMHIENLILAGKRIAVFPEGPYCAPLG